MTNQLDYFFHPNGVAVIGASRNPAKLSYGVVENLTSHGYQGPIYPVNPKGGEMLGLKIYPSIAEAPDPVELAVIMVPAPLVPGVMEDCGERGLPTVIVITGGFKEAGPEGAELERSLKEIAAKHGMRMIGPNCVGVMDTHLPLDTTFISEMPDAGHIGFASHSGAICGGTIDWALSVGVGYSRIASLGNQVDVDIADGIRMLYDDLHTHVISLYVEGLPDGRRFVEAAAEVYREKPIVMLKAGLTSAGTRAVASHTGALAGSGRAYEAACHRAGVLVVDSLQEQNDVAMALATQPLPSGTHVALLTNAGGPAALAADELDRQGLTLANLTEATKEKLLEVTPRGTQLDNPVDMLGGPQARMFEDAMDILQADPGVDMVMAIFVPQAITPVDEVARHIVAAAERMDKPVVACMVGGVSIPAAIKLLNHGGVPFYQDPNRASQALGGLWRYQQLISRPDLTPMPVAGVDAEQARALLQAAWTEASGQENGGQLFLDAEIAAQVAAAYGIRAPASELAATAEEAVAIAEEIARPVALKLIAPDVVHKADVGGIALGLQGAEEVRAAFEAMVDTEAGQQAMVQEMAPEGREVILGAQRDPQFGPLLMFGMGGIYVEVFKDVAFRLAPLAEHDAQEMIAETAAGQLLAGVRGEAAGDLAATVDTLRRVGQLVHDVPCIAEMDINPLIVGAEGKGAWAVDVRIAIDSAPGE